MRHLLLAAAMMLPFPALAQDAPVRINQLGFLPGQEKLAVLPSAGKAPLPWRVVDARRREVLHGETRVFGEDPSSGTPVHQVDFSALKPGQGYRLIVGTAESRPFAVAAGLYRPLARDALEFFYHHRAGTPIEARFVGAGWARPAGHASETAACFEGADQRGTVWPGCPTRFDVHGGWYDAGDQGKYVVNGGIALWTLLNSYERAALHGTARAFADGTAAIPEAGNGVNDLLDQARYEMEFLLRMQVPGAMQMRLPVGAPPPSVRPAPGTPPGPPPPLQLPMALVDVDGMAFQKVADRHWTKLPTPPAEDREERLLYPPTTGATLNLAATAAQCARIWRTIDPAFAARCLKAAERAWAGAKRNPELFAVGAFDGSGGYGDRDLSDEFYWAAAELFATTGKAEYGEAVRRSPHFSGAAQELSWNSTATLGTITLALVPNALGKDEVAGQRARIVAAADGFLADEARTGYRIPYAPAVWPWGSTSSLLNRAMLLGLASDWTGKPAYRAAVFDSLDFLLGRNAVDRSFVSGYGARPMVNPHHRFWAHSLDPKLPGPPPGVLSGGPNSGSFSDEAAKGMRGKCVGQTCWTDDIRAFTMNEIAINWNAPLVWVTSWAAE